MKPIVLTSNNAKAKAWVDQGGLSSVMTPALDAAVPSSASSKDGRTCTDFVLVGWSEDGDSVRDALLPHNPRRNLLEPVVLTSDHRHCTHFVTDSKCSTPLTNEDVLWMEKVAGCKPGTYAPSPPPPTCLIVRAPSS